MHNRQHLSISLTIYSHPYTKVMGVKIWKKLLSLRCRWSRNLLFLPSDTYYLYLRFSDSNTFHFFFVSRYAIKQCVLSAYNEGKLYMHFFIFYHQWHWKKVQQIFYIGEKCNNETHNFNCCVFCQSISQSTEQLGITFQAFLLHNFSIAINRVLCWTFKLIENIALMLFCQRVCTILIGISRDFDAAMEYIKNEH